MGGALKLDFLQSINAFFLLVCNFFFPVLSIRIYSVLTHVILVVEYMINKVEFRTCINGPIKFLSLPSVAFTITPDNITHILSGK